MRRRQQGLDGSARTHTSPLQDHQGVGQLHHFVGRMGDVEHGHLQMLAQRLQPRQHLAFALSVQRCQRLIQQQQPRLHGQRPGHGHALALATRQGGGAPLQQVANAQHLHRLSQRFLCSRLRVAGQALNAIVQVALHVQMLKQTGLLKHHTQAALPHRGEVMRRVVLPHGVAHLHPTLTALEPSHTAQQAGFARTRSTPQHADAVQRQAQVGLQIKPRALPLQLNVQGVAHVWRLSAWRRMRANSSSTAKANTAMPPANTWAWAYSMASTCP